VDDLTEGVEVGPAVGVHDALGPAGRPGRVVDGDAGELVVHRPGQRLVRAAAEQVGVREVRRLRRIRFGGAGGVDDRDHLLHAAQLRQDGAQRRQQLGVGDQQPGSGMVADVGDLLRRQPRVDRHQDGAGERHPEVRHQHLRDVGAQVRHPVAWPDPGGP
jgi:hypothetical protein